MKDLNGTLPFSLVTTCRNEINSLPIWKDNILAQTRSPSEIIIVDAYSDDGTFEALEKWAVDDSRVHVLQEKGAAAHGRNVAIENASNEIILSTDMGVRLASIWCAELIKPFECNDTVQVVMGNSVIDCNTVKTAVARAEYYLEGGGETLTSKGVVPNNRSVAYKKKIWRELGGLPEDLTFYADDSVFGRQIVQANYTILTAPKAMTYWARPSNMRSFWKEQYVYGVGDGEAAIKMPYVYRLYYQGRIPAFLVAPLNALRHLQRQSTLSGYFTAIKTGDFKALTVMPILLLGNGWHRVKGYMVGHERGVTQCVECRRRITGS